jgi:hypothetical protein
MQEYKSEDTWNYNFSCILYGCENWSLKLREERRLRVFENRVLNTIFGSATDEVTRVWRILHNEELNDVLPIEYYSGDQIKENEKGLSCSTYREMTGLHTVLVGKPE